MKKIAFLILIVSFSITSAQTIFNHEKRVGHEENYVFKELNSEGTNTDVIISGTLITPSSEYNEIVIIAPGSGKDTRNSHYLITEELLKNNIAVYRYDDRGVGKSKGRYNGKIDHHIMDLYFAITTIQKVKNLASKKIGILGHSKGGYAAICNYQEKLNIDFLILMATPLLESNGKFLNYKSKIKRKNVKQKIGFKFILQNINIPVLFISGDNDSIIDNEQSIVMLKELDNKNITIKTMNELDHYLKRGNDDWLMTKDYSSLYVMDDKALKEIINWIDSINDE